MRKKLIVLFCLIVTSFAAALIWKQSNPVEKKNIDRVTVSGSPSPVVLSAEEILQRIPVPTGNSETDKVVLGLLGQVRKSPKEPVGWINLGDALAQTMRDTEDQQYYDFAEIAYRHALDLNPKSSDAMIGMAWVTGGRHTFDQSVDWISRALEIDPDNVSAHGIAGDAALELGNYEGAFESYQKMMDLKPDLSSWSRGAYLLWLTGNSPKGRFLMDKAIKAGGPFAENTAWCRAKSALMLFHEGAYLPATQVLEPALTATPGNIHVLLAAGRVAAATGDLSKASHYYQKVLEVRPQHDALVALGDLAAASEKWDEAEKAYSQVEALYAAHAQAGLHSHLNMARFYADHDRNLVEALRIAEQSKLTKNVLEADTLAWVYFKNGNIPKASEAIKRALSQNTPDAEIHFHAGMIAAQTDSQVARKHLRQAISLNPNFHVLFSPVAIAMLDKLNNSTPATDTPTINSSEVGNSSVKPSP